MKKTILFLFFIFSVILLSQTELAFGTVENDAVSKGAVKASYIKFDGIDGESNEANHSGWFDLKSLKHQKTNAAGRPELIDCVKEVDKASPKLLDAFRGKKVFPNVLIDVVSSRSTYFRYELKNVTITSYQKNIGNDTARFRLNFEKILFTKHQTDNAGNTKSKLLYTWEAPQVKSRQ